MTSPGTRQKLSPSSFRRESLRQRGQFWTPDWVADAMVSYAIGDSSRVFDPAVGAGAFLRAAKRLAARTGRRIELRGVEVDKKALEQAAESGLTPADLALIELRDFITDPPARLFDAIVANPPYIRHHRLDSTTKATLRTLARNALGAELDGRAGLHVYFLIQSLQLLEPDGRLAFIVPADICEGVFATALWDWIARSFCIDAVIAFAPDASPFPGVDTNPLVVLIRNAEPKEEFWWVVCTREGDGLTRWTSSGFGNADDSLALTRRRLAEALDAGLSRQPSEIEWSGLRLGDLASVVRGIATGANDFFFLTTRQAAELGIGDEYLLPAIGRTRDVTGDEITSRQLIDLDRSGRPTRLLSIADHARSELPDTLLKYLQYGESLGLHLRPLISMRRHWFRVEQRPVPPILFAYLGRRNVRFIRNAARVVPLTGFLCVYPLAGAQYSAEQVWKILSHPDTAANLRLVAKSYGGGAIKVEPRALERLPIPTSAIAGLT